MFLRAGEVGRGWQVCCLGWQKCVSGMSAGGWEGESDLHQPEREEMSRKDPEPGQTESEKVKTS